MIPQDSEELRVLAGEYVLGVLDADEAAEVAAALAVNPELRRAVALWEEQLHPLSSLVSPAEPPSGTWQAIEERIKASAPKPAAQRVWDNITLWRWSTAGFAAGLSGGGAMAGNSYRLASAQLAQKDDQASAPQSRVGRAAALTGYTAKNLVGAPLADVGRRLSGNPAARHGLATWRMSADLTNRRRLIRDDLSKPKPPNDGGGNSIS